MSIDPRPCRGPLLPCLLLVVLLAGCVPRFHERQTLLFEPADADAVEIRYGNFDGCLLRREVPLEYRVRRAGYRLRIEIGSSRTDRESSLAVVLEGDGELHARFAGLASPPRVQLLDQGRRYVLAGAALPESGLRVEVLREAQLLGREFFAVRHAACRALSLGSTG